MKILLLHIARLHRVEGNLVRHMRTTPMPKVQCRRCSKYIIHRPDTIKINEFTHQTKKIAATAARRTTKIFHEIYEKAANAPEEPSLS